MAPNDGDGSVAVTLTVSVTMLLVLIGLATQTLAFLTDQLLLTHTVTQAAYDVADAADACAMLASVVTARMTDVAVQCEATSSRLDVTVTRPSRGRLAPTHTVTVVTHRDR
jgi:hypothetical protein